MVQTIADLFYQACAFQSPDALAYRKGGTYVPISHQELQARVERLALALESRGLKAGEPVALICENRPEWAIVDYACAISGLPSVPLYPDAERPPERLHPPALGSPHRLLLHRRPGPEGPHRQGAGLRSDLGGADGLHPC